MKYDPDALPFWEQSRGGGPVTDAVNSRRRLREEILRKKNRNRIELDIENARAGLSDGPVQKTARARVINLRDRLAAL